jgi:hypothetical protein
MVHSYQNLSVLLEHFHQTLTIEHAQLTISSIVELLWIEVPGRELCLYPQIAPLTFIEKAPWYADKKAVYEYIDTNRWLEVRLFCVNKIKKAMIAKGVTVTDNFEDGRAMFNKPTGIDFFADMKTGEIVMVISKEHQLRTMSLKWWLRNTQKIILDKRFIRDTLTGTTKDDMSIKSRNHKIIRDSLSLKELNKQFYVWDKKNPGIISFFTELKQHLIANHKSDLIVFDDTNVSQFVARMLGRIIFCEFLRKKWLINESYGYYEHQLLTASEYYTNKLQILFFEVLNKAIEERVTFIWKDRDSWTPFLNGGLFDAKENDYYQKWVISFPDDYFIRLFAFLEEYNFTTDESSSDYQQVAIDPEMLGRIFENLLAEETTETREQARKAKGAFYTPREVVDYMCRESLRQYLKEYCKNLIRADEAIDKLLDTKDHAWDKNIVADIKDYKTTVLAWLDNLTILDPACWSGAFPMGMVQLMTKLYERLDPTKDAYKVKLKIIKDTIFWVDIEPMAIEISRLRAWLALIVDEELQPQSQNLGIQPLPNLDFKFVCANSLIPLENEGNLFDEGQDDVLVDLRGQYFDANSREKKNLQKQYLNIVHKNDDLFLITKSPRFQKLIAYNPFDVASSAWFFDSKFMFGIDGFDIIIGNPPYIQLQKNWGYLANLYKNTGYKTFERSGDIYSLFYELSYNLLKEQGISTFITSNKWMRAWYGQSLRKFLITNTNPLFLIDLGSGVFDSATVDTNILIGQKKIINTFNLQALNLTKEKNITNIQSFHSTMIEINELSENSWTILTPIEQSIKAKIEKIGTPLKDWNISINYGIKTGFNEAFIISWEKKDELIKKDPKSAEIIRPILRGKDIKRYSYDFADLWLLYIPWHFPLHNDPHIQGASAKAEELFQQQYSAVYQHLLQYKKKLENRNKAETWIHYERYALQRWWANYRDDFNRQKLCRTPVNSEYRFAIVEANIFLNNGVFMITKAPLKMICSLMNSKLMIAYLNIISSADYQYGGKELFETIPLPKDLKDDIYSDDEITKIYDLTEEEINFISSSVKP